MRRRQARVMVWVDRFILLCGLVVIGYGVLVAQQRLRDIAVGGLLVLGAAASEVRDRRRLAAATEAGSHRPGHAGSGT